MEGSPNRRNIPATSRGCASNISPATTSSSRSLSRRLGGTPEATSSQFKAARDVGARITIHVGVGEFGRNAFLEKVNAIETALKDDTTYVHCCTLNDTEWKLIRDTGGTVSIAGYVEKLMGHGNPPIQKAIDNGIRP